MIKHNMSIEQVKMLESIFVGYSPTGLRVVPAWIKLLYAHIPKTYLETMGHAALDSQIASL